MYKILVTDDDHTILSGLGLHFQDNPEYHCVTADYIEAAKKILESGEFDLVVADLMFPTAAHGLEVMRCAREQWYRPAILAMTAFDTVENAVEAMKAGADDFASKGFGLDELILRIEHLIKRKDELRKLVIENEVMRQTLRQQYNDYQIVGKSRQIRELMEKVKKIAEDAHVTCLLEGESGTGKDLIARAIHTMSNRSRAPFIPINCAAIPSNLLESELFGHEKGSFTGAYTTRQGKFEQANEGVIFLDEISELPMSLQVVLLRVLEEKEIFRIGGKRPIETDVMILAASNQDLEQLVQENRFREDLFFRLNVIKIFIPPLRDRQEDIEPLAHFFLDKFNQQRNKNLRLSYQSLEMLNTYDYPGNVRELRNIIEDAFVFCDGDVIQPSDLRFNQYRKFQYYRDKHTLDNGNNGSLYEYDHQNAVHEFEKLYFTRLLENNHWNLKTTAEEAGISREWLSKKIRRLDLKKP